MLLARQCGARRKCSAAQAEEAHARQADMRAAMNNPQVLVAMLNNPQVQAALLQMMNAGCAGGGGAGDGGAGAGADMDA